MLGLHARDVEEVFCQIPRRRCFVDLGCAAEMFASTTVPKATGKRNGVCLWHLRHSTWSGLSGLAQRKPVMSWGSVFQGLQSVIELEAFCSTKTQSPPRKRQAGPILGLKDKHINLLLTPSWAGLECLPSLSLYEIDKSLEKQDYTHRTLQRQVAVVSCSKTSSALPARAAGWWEHCGRGSRIHLSPSLSPFCPYPCPQDSLAKQALPCTSSPPQAAGDAGQQLPLPWTWNLLFASAWCFPFIPDGTWLES